MAFGVHTSLRQLPWMRQNTKVLELKQKRANRTNKEKKVSVVLMEINGTLWFLGIVV